MEEWRKIKDFPNYSVSSFGKIRNNKTGYLFTLNRKSGGYIRVTLSNNERCQTKLIHLLVAGSFLNYNGNGTVDHIDRCRDNNAVNNLRVISHRENCCNKRQVQNKSRGVVQLTLAGEFVAQWDRIKDAPCRRSNIGSVCAGRLQSACGYKWKYVEDYYHDTCRWVEIQNVHVSEDGRVKLPSGKITYGYLNLNGYMVVNVDGLTPQVHRLVCTAFHGSPSHGMIVDHINRNRSDNRADNLRWTSPSENRQNSAVCDRNVRKTPVFATTIDGQEEFYNSIEEAAMNTGASKGNICMCCLGARKTAKGRTWQYIK